MVDDFPRGWNSELQPLGFTFKMIHDVLVFHGSADASVSMEEFAKLAVDLESPQISHEMIAYSGAPHAFTVFRSERYRKDADKKSWSRFTQFLKEVLD